MGRKTNYIGDVYSELEGCIKKWSNVKVNATLNN